MTALRATIQPSVPRLALRDHEAAEALGISRRTLWEWTPPTTRRPYPIRPDAGKKWQARAAPLPRPRVGGLADSAGGPSAGGGGHVPDSRRHMMGALSMSRPPPTVQEKLRLIRAMRAQGQNARSKGVDKAPANGRPPAREMKMPGAAVQLATGRKVDQHGKCTPRRSDGQRRGPHE